VAYQHVREQADPPSSLDPDLSPEIDAIVMKSLTKPVEDRYQSAAAMRADIERFLAGKPVVAPVVPTDDATTFLPHEAPAQSTGFFTGSSDDGEEQKKRRWPLVLLAVLIVALLIGAAILGPMLFNTEPEQSSVPNLGMTTRAQAEEQLIDAGLTLGDVDRQPSDDVRRGLVISQSPDPGTTLDEDAPVDILVSSGERDVVVPDILGENRVAARLELEGLGLRVRAVERDSDEEAGTVIDSDPRPVTSVPAGSLVTLFYSDGPTEVPSVIGMEQGRASQALTNAGFEVSVSFDPTTRAENGIVLGQSPGAFTEQPTGTTVVIIVSSYEEPEPTPRPTPTPTPTQSRSPSPTPTTLTTPPTASTTPTDDSSD